MNINHLCLSESAVWRESSNFRTALIQLRDIMEYLSSLKCREFISYPENFFEQMILENCTVLQCYNIEEDDTLADEKRMLIELLGQMTIYEDTVETHHNLVGIEFYPLSEDQKPSFRSACGLTEYLCQRRAILAEIASPLEFYAFMSTCFSNSAFSDDVLTGLKKISNFNEIAVREAIVRDLGVLNDCALEIYHECYPDFKRMIQVLKTKVLGCGLDPKNKKKLIFMFTYGDHESMQTKAVCCSPHTKLLRMDSNLRIYFSWRDDDVAPNKVLIGHIGPHPY